MTRVRRKRTSIQVKVVEGSMALGVVIGLASVAGSPPTAGVQTYVNRALGGALLGLAVALVVILAWRSRAAAPVAPRREAIPERVRHEVWRRDRGTCVECGSRGRLEFDHIIPVSRGGANTVRNIELRCEPCNRRKGARV
jgi:hypothetical protein